MPGLPVTRREVLSGFAWESYFFTNILISTNGCPVIIRRRTDATVSITTNRACTPAHICSFRACRLWFGIAFVSYICLHVSCDAETYDPRCPFAPGAFLDLGPCPVGRAALWTRQNGSGLLARTEHHEGYLEPESHCAAPRLAWVPGAGLRLSGQWRLSRPG